MDFPLPSWITSKTILVLVYGGFHSHGGNQKWLVYIGKSHLEMDDLGVTPISGNPHMVLVDQTPSCYVLLDLLPVLTKTSPVHR